MVSFSSISSVRPKKYRRFEAVAWLQKALVLQKKNPTLIISILYPKTGSAVLKRLPSDW